jgi:hypothetical protein
MALRTTGLLFTFCGLLTTANPAWADVIVTLEAFGQDGQPITGPVAAGTDVTVDLLLSADAEDDPVVDVRLIQFDFEATDSNIDLVSFTWTVDANGYSFQDPDLPLTNVTAVHLNSAPGMLTLTTEPVKVASVDITINGSATLDAVNPANTDPNYGADVRAGFGLNEPARQFTFPAGNLQGGSLEFSVGGDDGGGGSGGGTPPGGGGSPTDDYDGDGVADVDDAFPVNPNETTDTNGDGVGNNADPDDDSDGVVDEEDDLPVNPDETTDSDGDNEGDNADPDDDGDNVADDGDAFPDDPAEAMDSDDDGIGNNADADDDNDGVADADDAAPLNPAVGGNSDDGDTANGSQPRMCGAGMLGSSLLMLMGLSQMSYLPRRRF